jgi:hypothetical protein
MSVTGFTKRPTQGLAWVEEENIRRERIRRALRIGAYLRDAKPISLLGDRGRDLDNTQFLHQLPPLIKIHRDIMGFHQFKGFSGYQDNLTERLGGFGLKGPCNLLLASPINKEKGLGELLPMERVNPGSLGVNHVAFMVSEVSGE